MNLSVISGRVIMDPEIKVFTNGDKESKKVSMTLAVRGASDQKNDEGYSGYKDGLFNVVLWGGNADFVEKHVSKGSVVEVTGENKISQWTDDSGNKRSRQYINANHVGFAPKGFDNNGSTTTQTTNTPSTDDTSYDPFAE